MDKIEALRSAITSIREAERKIAGLEEHDFQDGTGNRLETDRLIDQLLEVASELDDILVESEEDAYQVNNQGEEDFDEDYDEWDGTDDEHGYDCDCDECQDERDQENCGELPPDLGGGCSSAGSEYCDFECPFRNRVLNGTDEDADEDEDHGDEDK